MTESIRNEFTLTSAETLAKIRSQPAKTIFYLSIHFLMPIVREDAEKQFGDPDKVFHGFTTLKTSRANLIKLASESMIKGFEARGGRLNCREYINGDYRAFYLF